MQQVFRTIRKKVSSRSLKAEPSPARGNDHSDLAEGSVQPTKGGSPVKLSWRAFSRRRMSLSALMNVIEPFPSNDPSAPANTPHDAVLEQPRNDASLTPPTIVLTDLSTPSTPMERPGTSADTPGAPDFNNSGTSKEPSVPGEMAIMFSTTEDNDRDTATSAENVEKESTALGLTGVSGDAAPRLSTLAPPSHLHDFDGLPGRDTIESSVRVDLEDTFPCPPGRPPSRTRPDLGADAPSSLRKPSAGFSQRRQAARGLEINVDAAARSLDRATGSNDSASLLPPRPHTSQSAYATHPNATQRRGLVKIASLRGPLTPPPTAPLPRIPLSKPQFPAVASLRRPSLLSLRSSPSPLSSVATGCEGCAHPAGLACRIGNNRGSICVIPLLARASTAGESIESGTLSLRTLMRPSPTFLRGTSGSYRSSSPTPLVMPNDTPSHLLTPPSQFSDDSLTSSSDEHAFRGKLRRFASHLSMKRTRSSPSLRRDALSTPPTPRSPTIDVPPQAMETQGDADGSRPVTPAGGSIAEPPDRLVRGLARMRAIGAQTKTQQELAADAIFPPFSPLLLPPQRSPGPSKDGQQVAAEEKVEEPAPSCHAAHALPRRSIHFDGRANTETSAESPISPVSTGSMYSTESFGTTRCSSELSASSPFNAKTFEKQRVLWQRVLQRQ